LPQFQDSLSSNTNLHLKIPISFGKLSSSPAGAQTSVDTQNTTIDFNKFNPKEKLVITMGEYQLFNFDITYYLQNTSSQKANFLYH
jgi:hypothetical protein